MQPWDGRTSSNAGTEWMRGSGRTASPAQVVCFESGRGHHPSDARGHHDGVHAFGIILMTDSGHFLEPSGLSQRCRGHMIGGVPNLKTTLTSTTVLRGYFFKTRSYTFFLVASTRGIFGGFRCSFDGYPLVGIFSVNIPLTLKIPETHHPHTRETSGPYYPSHNTVCNRFEASSGIYYVGADMYCGR
jgi:hypothetical protein